MKMMCVCECDCMYLYIHYYQQLHKRAKTVIMYICTPGRFCTSFARLRIKILNVVLKADAAWKTQLNTSNPHFIHTRFIIFMLPDLICTADFPWTIFSFLSLYPICRFPTSFKLAKCLTHCQLAN